MSTLILGSKNITRVIFLLYAYGVSVTHVSVNIRCKWCDLLLDNTDFFLYNRFFIGINFDALIHLSDKSG